MLNRLRLSFVKNAMLSVIIVLAAILGLTIVVTYHLTTRVSDQVLNELSETNGVGFPADSDIPEIIQDSARYFIVRLDNDDKRISFDNIHCNEVSQIEGMNLALQVSKSRTLSSNQYLGTYRYLVSIDNKNTLTKTDDIKTIIFLEDGERNNIFKTILLGAFIVFVSIILGVWVLLLSFSKRAIEPIAATLEKQKKFITNASHELKTPLTVIAANNEILEMDHGESEETRIIAQSVKNMVDMTNNMTLLAKVEETATSTKSIFNLSEAAFETIMPYKSLYKRRNIVFDYHIKENIVIKADERVIRDCLVILLDNASKYAKSHIEFEVTSDKSKIKIASNNDTTGISKGNLSKYAERFYRTDEVRGENISGSGVGLSILRDAVDMYNGDFKLYSEDGIIFSVEIIIRKVLVNSKQSLEELKN